MKRVFTLALIVSAALVMRAEVIYGLTTTNTLFVFDSATPGTQTNLGALSGLTAGQIPVGMDFRPATGELYLMGYQTNTFVGQLYTVNLSTAALTKVGAGFTLAAASTTNTTTVTNAFGFDFNPTVDRIRVIRGDGANVRLNPVTGAIAATDASLTWDASTGLSGVPQVCGLAYANNYPGANTSTLFGYDFVQSLIVRVGSVNGTPNSPNGGLTFKVASTSFFSASLPSFDLDISGATGIGYAAINNSLYTFNTNSGALTIAGLIIGKSVADISVLPSPLPYGERIYGLTTNGTLFYFDSLTPGTQKTVGAVTGMTSGHKAVGIDFRPATGELFLMSYSTATFAGQLYTVNLTNAALTPVGAGFTLANSSATNSFGFDFNPTVDRIRLVRADGVNYRLNPTTGVIALQDTSVTWSNGFTGTPQLSGMAYANNFSGATTTTLYGYEFAQNRFVTLGGLNSSPSPNAGLTIDVGASGLTAASPAIGLDISGNSGTAYGVVDNQFYRFNTNSGAATLVGAITGQTVEDLAVFPLRITQLSRVNGATTNSDVAVTFTSSPGLRYNLQRLTNLTDTVWADAVTNIAGLTNTTTVTNANGATLNRRFYRVTAQP